MQKQQTPKYRILLYYKYVRINDSEKYTQIHLDFCKALGIKGRILVAPEGINGTVSGTYDQTKAYMSALRMDERFTDMEFKIDEAEEHAFKKIFVRHKKEIVTMNLEDDVDPNITTGKRLSPKEFYKALNDEDTVVIDARNNYEYDLGHFRGAVKIDSDNFKEFPDFVKQNLMQYKDKKVLTYCTGGVRCEKFSGLLLKMGFKDVSQLHGGIVSYSKDNTVKGRAFEGRCYVFDERISVPVNFTEDAAVVGKCYLCGEPCERYVNCANYNCHNHFICCEECDAKTMRSCSTECMNSERHEMRVKGQLSAIS